MDIASLIASFATGTYTVTRTARGVTTRGIQTAGTSTPITITASITPASGRDLDRLPEGRYDNETRVLYTTTQLYVGGQDQAIETDTILIDGVEWEVQHVETWIHSGPGQTGYKCLIQRP